MTWFLLVACCLTSIVALSVGQQSDVTRDLPVVITVTMHCVTAAWLFVTSGGSKITPLGTFAVASVTFLAVPYAVEQLWYPGHGSLGKVGVHVGLFAFAVAAGTAKIFDFHDNQKLLLRRPNNPDGFLCLTASGILLATYFAAAATEWGARTLSDAVIFGIVGIGALLLAKSAGRYWSLLGMGLMAVGIALYLGDVYTGHGRLRLVSLAWAPLMLITLQWRPRLLKLLLICAFPLVLLTFSEEARDAQLRPGLGSAGLISYSAPLESLSDISNEVLYTPQPLWPLLWGESYRYALFDYWIPRAVWPDKGEGLGRVYARYSDPELADKGHSVSVSYVGEAILNFGWLGIVLVPVLAGIAIGAVSRRFDVMARSLSSNSALVAYAVGSASLLDFVWADSNTFVQRGALRILAVLIAFAVAKLIFGAIRLPRSYLRSPIARP